MLYYLIYYNKDYLSSNNSILYSSLSSIQSKINEVGRIITIKFQDEMDGVKVFLNKIRINLPLVNNHKGFPEILPGSLLVEFMKGLNRS